MQRLETSVPTAPVQHLLPSAFAEIRAAHSAPRDTLNSHPLANTPSCLSQVFACVESFFHFFLTCFNYVIEWIWPLNLNLAAIEAARGLQINADHLGERPAKIDFTALDRATAGINYTQMLEQFDLLFPVLPPVTAGMNSNQIRLHDMEIAVRNQRREELEGYIEFVFLDNTYQSDLYTTGIRAFVKSDLYTTGIRAFVKGIIFQLTQPNEAVPLAKKRVAILALCEARFGCDPRKYEEAKRQYLNLTNQLSIRQQLFTWLQLLKEDIIIQAFQTWQFHVINRARCMPNLARKWGLDNDEVSLNDPNRYVTSGADFTEQQADQVLESNYIPICIIAMVKHRFEMEGDNPLLNEYLQANTDSLPPNWEADFYEPHPHVADQMTLSHKGAAWLLQNEGFLCDLLSCC